MTDSQELKRLRALYSYEILDTGPEPEFDELARLAAAVTNTPMAMVTLIDERRQWFKARHEFPYEETERSIAFCNHTIMDDVPFIVEDTFVDDRFRENKFVVGEPGIRFYAGVPLIVRNGERLGTLAVIHRKPHKLEPPQLEHLSALARQVVALLDLRMERNRHRETTKRLANAQFVGKMGTWEHYLDSEQLIWSPEVHEIFGTTPETFDGNLEAFQKFVHPDDLKKVIDASPPVIAGEMELDLVHRIIRPDGEIRHVRECARLFRPEGSGRGLIIGTVQDITDEVRAASRDREVQRELQQAHDILKFHIENSPLGVVEWNHEFRVIRWSRRAREIFGWDEGEVFGFHPDEWKFIHPDDSGKVGRMMGKLLDMTLPRNSIQSRNYTRDGRIIHCEWYNSVLKDDDGNLVSIFSLVHDVTERVLYEERFRQSQALARIGGKMGRIGGWSIDASTQKIRWSEDIFTLLEWDGEEAPTLEQCLAMYPGESRQQIGRAVEDCLELGHPFDLEHEIVTAKGRRIYARSIGEVERDDGGKILRVIGAFQDITEMRSVRDQYESFARRLRLTLENMPDGFYLLDHDWNYIYMNAQAEKILGLNSSDLLGKNVWEKFPGLKDSEVHDYFNKAVKTGESQHYSIYYDVMKEWFQVDVHPSSEGLAVYFRKITERLKLEEQLRQSQRLETVGHLTGGIAHDFNNLLTVVLGNSELLLEELEDNKRLAPLAEMIRAAASRGADLTHRLLAFARKQPLEPKRLEVNALIRGMNALLKRTLGEDVEIEILTGAKLWHTFVDGAQLENALLNLALNARDAMPQGGHLTIETSNILLDEAHTNDDEEFQPGEYVLLAVSDTGMGIPREHIDRVIEPFYTTKESGKGTGLGLSMVYGFVKQSRGHVRIYSEVGEGTTVKIYLPREESEPLDDISGQPLASLQGGEEIILVVEDDEQVRTYAAGQLAALGYQVLTAENAPAALEILAKRRDIDLLFTDIVMPGGMNGRQLADKAREMHPNLKVLYTSGYTENAIIHHGRLDPGAHLLSKPYTRAQLAGKIREVLAGDTNQGHQG